MDRFRVTKVISFCYGHRLLDYEGPCKNLHGHNGRLELTYASDVLDDLGMLLDFSEIKRVMKAWVDANMDHRLILARADPLLETLREAGEPVFVLDDNPTAENIAKRIFAEARSSGHPVERVRLWETETSWAEYRERR